LIRAAAAVMRRPRLWATAVRQIHRTAAPGWWRRPPFVPIPSRGYLDFRLVTQYGETSRQLDAHDVVNYLSWCRDFNRATDRRMGR
jgi:hypothetical protein